MTDPSPLSPSDQQSHAERTFLSSDGYPIQTTEWKPPGPARGSVVVLHGVQSHSGWYHALGRSLAHAGFRAYFPNRRGSGPHVLDRGHAPSANRLVRDVSEFLETIRRESADGPMILAGISWGGKLVVVTAARHPRLIDGIALICPGLEPRVGVSTREKVRIAWALLTKGSTRFPIPLSDPSLFTADPQAQAWIAADPLRLQEGTAGLMASSFFLDRMVRRAPRKVHQPALLMLAGQDRIVDNDRTRDYFKTLASRDRRIIEYPEGHHTLEFEPDPGAYARDLIGWIENQFLCQSKGD
jgi:acylglycerol lipase